MNSTSRRPPPWMLFSAAALTASLAHGFIDYHIGLFGKSSTVMSLFQAANILFTCLVMAWWAVSLATANAGTRPDLSGAYALSVGWALLANGAAAVVAVPPPSAAFPYQDIAHFSSLIFGVLAAYTTWKEVIVDRAVWHRGEEVAVFLNTHPRLHLDYLPCYQPGLNAQERIWRRIRYEATTNRWFEELDDIWATVRKTTHAWSPQKVRRLCHID